MIRCIVQLATDKRFVLHERMKSSTHIWYLILAMVKLIGMSRIVKLQHAATAMTLLFTLVACFDRCEFWPTKQIAAAVGVAALLPVVSGLAVAGCAAAHGLLWHIARLLWHTCQSVSRTQQSGCDHTNSFDLLQAAHASGATPAWPVTRQLWHHPGTYCCKLCHCLPDHAVLRCL